VFIVEDAIILATPRSQNILHTIVYLSSGLRETNCQTELLHLTRWHWL
jgi:hypothetical protein